MKKYLTLAAAVALTAFISASYLAHAEGDGAMMKKEDTTMMDKNKADCEAASMMKKADGTDPTADEKAAALKKCMDDKAASGKPATEDAMKPGEKK